MLSRKYRLSRPLKSRDIRKISSPTLIVASVENILNYNRFIFIVSRKIDKRAVVRNKIKRILAFQIEKIYNDLAQGFDIAITVRREIAQTPIKSRQTPKEILCEELTSLLKKQNLL